MREEIRLGNEALGRNDLEGARQHFQKLLAKGGTEVQLRIARNRLQEIQDREEVINNPTPTKKRAPRKTASRAKHVTDEPTVKLVRPPDNPVVVINKH
jgi:hypothetical protein